ncbi:MAG: DUF4258 domain-containing protein [Candidatus Kuenenbacteria bacterium]
MKIIISPHAKLRMALRNISREMVQLALANPDYGDTGYLGRNLAYKKFGNKYIKVVYIVENNTYSIITIIWQTKI